jgi:hypothetical protein
MSRIGSDPATIVGRQLELTWRLAQVTLDGITLEECLWVPAAESWSVRPGPDGRWEADWQEPEPEDPPPPSLGWQLWHAAWWWSMVIDHSFGQGALTRETFEWSGPEQGFDQIERLYRRWSALITDLPSEQWESAELTRWPYRGDRPFAHLAGWVNAELMKNVAEMHLTRRYHALAC